MPQRLITILYVATLPQCLVGMGIWGAFFNRQDDRRVHGFSRGLICQGEAGRVLIPD